MVFRFSVQPKPEPKPAPVPVKEPEEAEVAKVTPPKPKQKYVRTDGSQTQGKVETDLIGEHDTVARSTADATDSAPDRAAVAGQKRDFDQQVASNHQDGNLEHDSIAQKKVEENTPTPPPAMPPKANEPEIVPEKPAEKVAKSPERKPLMDSPNQVEVTESAEQKAREAELAEKKAKEEAEEKARLELAKQLEEARMERERQEEEKRLKEEAEKRREEEKRKKQMAKRESEAGFRATTTPTESVGSIRRKGSQASLNVKSTPTGRYMKKVSDSVAKEWYRRCSERADLLLPGSITMYWFVNEDGSITPPQIKNQVAGGEIQKGITIQSINAAKIPPMPKEVREELNGDQLYFQINFEF